MSHKAENTTYSLGKKIIYITASVWVWAHEKKLNSHKTCYKPV